VPPEVATKAVSFMALPYRIGHKKCHSHKRLHAPSATAPSTTASSATIGTIAHLQPRREPSIIASAQPLYFLGRRRSFGKRYRVRPFLRFCRYQVLLGDGPGDGRYGALLTFQKSALDPLPNKPFRRPISSPASDHCKIAAGGPPLDRARSRVHYFSTAPQSSVRPYWEEVRMRRHRLQGALDQQRSRRAIH
jgi:hypothetical protein